MINVILKNDSLLVSGHALFAKKNYDIVCAGVSAIVLGAIFHWKNNTNLVIKQDQQKAYIQIDFKDQCLVKDQKLLAEYQLMISQLKVLEQHYSQYLKLEF